MSSLLTEISSLLKLYKIYLNVGVTKQQTIVRWLKAHCVPIFTNHTSDKKKYILLADGSLCH